MKTLSIVEFANYRTQAGAVDVDLADWDGSVEPPPAD